MRGYLVYVLLAVHLLVSTVAQPDRPEIEIVVMSPSVESNSIDLEWRLAGEDEDIQQVFISAIYNGPCTEVQLPPKVVVLSPPMTDQYTITGLQEFSNYLVNVTLVTASGVGTRLRTLITKGGAPSYQVTLRFQSATMTNLTVTWTPIPCLDLNSRLEEYIIILTPFNPLQSRIQLALPSISSAHTFTGLMPASHFTVELNATYTVSDVNPIVMMEIAAPISASTFAIPGPHTLRVVSVRTTTITVSWQQEEPTDNLTGYQVVAQYVGPCPSILHRVDERIPIASWMYIFENLIVFGTYDVIITSVSTTNQNASTQTNVQTLPTAPSAPPSSVRTLDLQAFSLTLVWDIIECEQRRSEISSYVVYFAPSALYSVSSRSNVSGLTNTTVSIADLVESTSYAFQVQGVNREGLFSPSSPILLVRTPAPPPPPSNLSAISGATSAILSWVPLSSTFEYTIVATYLGPCTDARVPPLSVTVQNGRGLITGLEEFGSYVAMVTPQGGRVASSVNFSTSAADPAPADDHVRHISSTDTSIVLQAPPINCIDQNGHISEFRLRYAQTGDFMRGVNIRNGLFSPGLVIVGNLEPGTQYVFQLRIVTEQGGSVILDPLTASTAGFQRGTTSLPTDDPTLSETPGDGPSTDAIITTVVLVVGICGLIAITAIILVCLTWRRCGHRVQRSDKERLIGKEAKQGHGVQNMLSDLENVESDPFERQLKSPPFVGDERWEDIGLTPTSDKDMEFSKMEWMTGLGENPTAAIYQEEFDEELDEAVFEPASDSQ